jgi:hypothetical protein
MKPSEEANPSATTFDLMTLSCDTEFLVAANLASSSLSEIRILVDVSLTRGS